MSSVLGPEVLSRTYSGLFGALRFGAPAVSGVGQEYVSTKYSLNLDATRLKTPNPTCRLIPYTVCWLPCLVWAWDRIATKLGTLKRVCYELTAKAYTLICLLEFSQ